MCFISKEENKLLICKYWFNYRNQEYIDLLEDETLLRIAKKYYKTAAQVSLRWLFQRGIVSVPRAVEIEHIIENAQV